MIMHYLEMMDELMRQLQEGHPPHPPPFLTPLKHLQHTPNEYWAGILDRFMLQLSESSSQQTINTFLYTTDPCQAKCNAGDTCHQNMQLLLHRCYKGQGALPSNFTITRSGALLDGWVSNMIK
jgi:hypothetical protein